MIKQHIYLFTIEKCITYYNRDTKKLSLYPSFINYFTKFIEYYDVVCFITNHKNLLKILPELVELIKRPTILFYERNQDKIINYNRKFGQILKFIGKNQSDFIQFHIFDIIDFEEDLSHYKNIEFYLVENIYHNTNLFWAILTAEQLMRDGSRIPFYKLVEDFKRII